MTNRDAGSGYLQVATTLGSQDEARRVARALVEQRLAACVQIGGPIESHYWWQGKLESSQEWQCVAKTRADLYDKIEAAIKQLHPYDEPEIIATPITAGSAGYLSWIDSETSS